MSKSKPTYELRDEIVFSENHNFPIDDIFKILLKNIQRNSECRNKVPVLTIGKGRDTLVIYSLARAREVLAKDDRKGRVKAERNLLRMARRQ